MNNCPNCLANNSFTKVYEDGLVLIRCEYCNTVIEDKTIPKEIVKSEVQDEFENEYGGNVNEGNTHIHGCLFLVLLAIGVFFYIISMDNFEIIHWIIIFMIGIVILPFIILFFFFDQ
ncbi:hypothetical protein [Lysinibacillus sp. Y5S-8]|uniref:hypothetical protein n=1 Tax=Lysinibacillus sp. Y5S-8 TaxID=3122488 RepID=UPI0030CE4FEB